MKEYFAKTKISSSDRGITIEISPHSSMFDELLQHESISMTMLFLGGGASIATLIFLAVRLEIIDWRLMVAGIGSGIISVFMGLFPLLYALVKQETIRLSGQYLLLKTTIWKMGRTRRYLINRLSNFHHFPVNNRRLGKVRFHYERRDVSFGARLSPDDAQMLVDYLPLCLAFRCHCVERIHFGKPPLSMRKEDYTVLYNPDVSPLTIAFARLNTLAIDVETYDFRLVERFLTYGVNYLSQEYLRNRVTVQVYGDIQNLQPNLRNALTNLCQSIQVHEKESSLV